MSRHHRTRTTAAFLIAARKRIAPTLPAPCVNRCQLGGIVYPHQQWDAGHIIDRDAGGTDTFDNVGPAHSKCNRSDGGKRGAAITNAARRARKGMRPW